MLAKGYKLLFNFVSVKGFTKGILQIIVALHKWDLCSCGSVVRALR